MHTAAEVSTLTAKEHRDRLQTLLKQFQLSDKMKFAIKASLSLVLAYLIAFSQGWDDNATTAVTTIMLIAATGSLGDSVTKGMLRVTGTLIGAVIGMVLIALFPQERALYLISVSILVTILLYFARAYKGDMTIFLLTAITLMTMFQDGEVDNVFLYGIDKTFMTVFGIAVYTFVGLFLWPVSIKDDSIAQAEKLSRAQHTLFQDRDADKTVRTQQHQTLIETQLALEQRVGRTGSNTENNFSRTQWASVLEDFKSITRSLTLLAYEEHMPHIAPDSSLAADYRHLETEINRLFEEIEQGWSEAREISLPKPVSLHIDLKTVTGYTELEKAALSSTFGEMVALRDRLRMLAEKLNALNAPMPTHFPLTGTPASNSHFLWFDPEHLKGSIVTFLIFWTGVLFWITLNPPGGFYIITLATSLSVITAFTPVKPSLLIIVFSLAFVFATAMYVGVLPHLSYGWELALFIFLYGFIGFYFIKPEISIFFLLGMATLNITNQMYYAFDLFLLVLMVFYAFLFLLLLYYYVPFSTKPEHLFLTMKRRFFRLSASLLAYNHRSILGEARWWERLVAHYSRHHLMSTVKKMQLWASQIDETYFEGIKKETLLACTKSCEHFAYMLLTMHHNNRKHADNPLLQDFLTSENTTLFRSWLTSDTASPKDPEKHLIEKIEAQLSRTVAQSTHTPKQLMAFYTAVSLHKYVWSAFLTAHTQMKKINFNVLEQSRF